MSDPKSKHDKAKHPDSSVERRARDSVVLPRVSLRPTRLLTSAALRKAQAAGAPSEVKKRTQPARDAGSPVSAPDPRHSTPTPNPIELFALSAQKRARAQSQAAFPQEGQEAPERSAKVAPQADAVPSFGYLRSGKEGGKQFEADQWRELEVLLARLYRRLMGTVQPLLGSHSRLSWGYLRTHRKLAGAVAVAILALFFVDSSILRNGYSAAGNAVEPYVNLVKSRAAYQIVDDFNTVGEWWGEGLVPEEPGAVRVAGFALHRGTMDLTSYRMDFDAKIERRSVGWLVRAADRDTYYAFKLTESQTGKTVKHQLLRYPVVQGRAEEAKKSEVDLPDQLIRDDFNRISVRIRDSQIVTFINGRSVDYWTDARVPKGGVGFWVEKDESGVISKMAVSGNEDFWGLTLYAALETADAVGNFVKSLISDPDEVASQLKRGVSGFSSTALSN